MIAGVCLIAGSDGGQFWLAGGARVAVAGSVYNGWILLVEVVRKQKPQGAIFVPAALGT